MRARFDQQPIEATALLLAAEAAWSHARGSLPPSRGSAYAWFLGANDLAWRSPIRTKGAPRCLNPAA